MESPNSQGAVAEEKPKFPQTDNDSKQSVNHAEGAVGKVVVHSKQAAVFEQSNVSLLTTKKKKKKRSLPNVFLSCFGVKK